MINLLPPELKREYHYARRNTLVLRWIILFGFGLAGLVIISIAGMIYLQQAAGAYVAQAVITEKSLQQQKQDEVEKQAQDISSSLKLAVQVLSQEVLFSKLLRQLAIITPNNASLSTLVITSQLQGGVDITAKTADYNAATQLQVNLTDPSNRIFAKADIISINCVATPSGQSSQPRYPCTVTIRALFAQDNPFLFINNKAGR
ncbi:MAG TPA: hypothetical protein VJ836_07875 [Candidatus Saccharimonadales bacterium]|nr:hypothetical protein [Candidatus Saccharimonadales bacterium]